MEQYNLDKAHEYSSNHRPELEKDNICGCFFCCQIYNPSEIEEWCDGGTTAICPKCDIDSVIGESSGFPITKEFLIAMNKRWFS